MAAGHATQRATRITVRILNTQLAAAARAALTARTGLIADVPAGLALHLHNIAAGITGHVRTATPGLITAISVPTPPAVAHTAGVSRPLALLVMDGTTMAARILAVPAERKVHRARLRNIDHILVLSMRALILLPARKQLSATRLPAERTAGLTLLDALSAPARATHPSRRKLRNTAITSVLARALAAMTLQTLNP